MKSKYFLTLVRMQAGAGLVAENLNVQGNIEDNFQGQSQGLTVQGQGLGTQGEAKD